MQPVPQSTREYIESIYDIPKEQNIQLSTLEEKGFVKAQTAKKLIHAKKLLAVRFGHKFFVPRMELIRYLANELNIDTPDLQSGVHEAKKA